MISFFQRDAFLMSWVNSSKEIWPSPLASTCLMMESMTDWGILFSCAVSTYLISEGVIEPELSLSNILKATIRRSFESSAFSLALATTNSV